MLALEVSTPRVRQSLFEHMWSDPEGYTGTPYPDVVGVCHFLNEDLIASL